MLYNIQDFSGLLLIVVYKVQLCQRLEDFQGKWFSLKQVSTLNERLERKDAELTENKKKYDQDVSSLQTKVILDKEKESSL